MSRRTLWSALEQQPFYKIILHNQLKIHTGIDVQKKQHKPEKILVFFCASNSCKNFPLIFHHMQIRHDNALRKTLVKVSVLANPPVVYGQRS